MKIILLNGSPDENKYPFKSYLQNLAGRLSARQHQVRILHLREMEIQYCRGCWGCWVKTPGECLLADDSQLVRREVIGADFVLFASPIIMGFTSALLKRAMDKMIPLVHPYITLVQGECHHVARYAHYPLLGLLTSRDAHVDTEDVDITTAIFERMALNFKSRLAFSKSLENGVEEVADEIIAD